MGAISPKKACLFVSLSLSDWCFSVPSQFVTLCPWSLQISFTLGGCHFHQVCNGDLQDLCFYSGVRTSCSRVSYLTSVMLLWTQDSHHLCFHSQADRAAFAFNLRISKCYFVSGAWQILVFTLWAGGRLFWHLCLRRLTLSVRFSPWGLLLSSPCLRSPAITTCQWPLTVQLSLHFTEWLFFPGCIAQHLSRTTNSAVPLDNHHSPNTPLLFMGTHSRCKDLSHWDLHIFYWDLENST